MRFDVRDQFSDAQVVTATAVSTSSKKKPAAQDLAIGDAMGVALFVDSTATQAGTLTVEMIEADDAALTTNIVSVGSVVFNAADLLAGKQYFIEQAAYKSSKEYYGVRYTPAGGLTTVTVSAYHGKKCDTANYKSFQTVYTVDNV